MLDMSFADEVGNPSCRTRAEHWGARTRSACGAQFVGQIRAAEGTRPLDRIADERTHARRTLISAPGRLEVVEAMLRTQLGRDEQRGFSRF